MQAIYLITGQMVTVTIPDKGNGYCEIQDCYGLEYQVKSNNVHVLYYLNYEGRC